MGGDSEGGGAKIPKRGGKQRFRDVDDKPSQNQKSDGSATGSMVFATSHTHTHTHTHARTHAPSSVLYLFAAKDAVNLDPGSPQGARVPPKAK